MSERSSSTTACSRTPTNVSFVPSDFKWRLMRSVRLTGEWVSYASGSD